MTAEEFKQDLFKNKKPFYTEKSNTELMIEFAKFHVEAALKAAKKKTYKKISMRNYEDELYKDDILTNSILNAYPLDSIK